MSRGFSRAAPAGASLPRRHKACRCGPPPSHGSSATGCFRYSGHRCRLTMGAALALDSPIAVAGADLGLSAPATRGCPPRSSLSTVIATTAICVVSGFFGDPTAIVVAAPVLAATIVIRIPIARERVVWQAGVTDPGLAGRICKPRFGRSDHGEPSTRRFRSGRQRASGHHCSRRRPPRDLTAFWPTPTTHPPLYLGAAGRRDSWSR